MVGRRRNGEGTYGTRTIKGKKYYFFRLTDERRTTIYAKTEKELREKVKDREKKGVIENKPDYKTFGDYIMYVWLPSKKKKIDVTTYDSYEEQLGYTLINYKDYDLANTQLQNIKPEILQKYLDALAENYSHSTIVHIAAELDTPFEGVDRLIEKMEVEMAWGNKKLESRMKTLEKTRLMVDRLNEALTVLKKKPNNGERLYRIIYYTYIYPEQVSHKELLLRLDLSTRHYYRLRKEAISIISVRLWSAPTADVNIWMKMLTLLEEFA